MQDYCVKINFMLFFMQHIVIFASITNSKTNIIINMNEVEAKKVKKISWTETVGNMVVGAVLICSLKEKLSAGSIISRYKKEKPEVEFSKWKEVGKDKYQVTRLK